jgi:hypothetical protein
MVVLYHFYIQQLVTEDDYFELKFRKTLGLRLAMHEFDLPP